MDKRPTLNISAEELEAKLQRMNRPLGPPAQKQDELADKLHRMQQPTPKSSSNKRTKADPKEASGSPLPSTPKSDARMATTELADVKLELKKALKELRRREEQLAASKDESRAQREDLTELNEKHKRLSERSGPNSDASILQRELSTAMTSLAKARKELEEAESAAQARQKAFRDECEKQQRKEMSTFKEVPPHHALTVSDAAAALCPALILRCTKTSWKRKSPRRKPKPGSASGKLRKKWKGFSTPLPPRNSSMHCKGSALNETSRTGSFPSISGGRSHRGTGWSPHCRMQRECSSITIGLEGRARLPGGSGASGLAL